VTIVTRRFATYAGYAAAEKQMAKLRAALDEARAAVAGLWNPPDMEEEWLASSRFG
jgi:hypothetical protein